MANPNLTLPEELVVFYKLYENFATLDLKYLAAATIGELVLQKRLDLDWESFGIKVIDPSPTGHKVLDAALKLVSSKKLHDFEGLHKGHDRRLLARELFGWIAVLPVQTVLTINPTAGSRVYADILRDYMTERRTFVTTEKKGWFFTSTVYKFVDTAYEKKLNQVLREAVANEQLLDDHSRILVSLIYTNFKCEDIVTSEEFFTLDELEKHEKKLREIYLSNKIGRALSLAVAGCILSDINPVTDALGTGSRKHLSLAEAVMSFDPEMGERIFANDSASD